MASSPMNIRRVGKAGVAHPFGDTREVSQAFPLGIPSEESDPFLMCDFWDSTEMDDLAKDDDDFPIGWVRTKNESYDHEN
jgi:hypothetical protein